MKTLLKRFFPAVLLLTASAALAESPVEGAAPDASVREVLGTARPQATTDQKLQELTQTVQFVRSEVEQLQALEAKHPAPIVDLGGPNDHPLWP
jgi:hypothetical protein